MEVPEFCRGAIGKGDLASQFSAVLNHEVDRPRGHRGGRLTSLRVLRRRVLLASFGRGFGARRLTRRSLGAPLGKKRREAAVFLRIGGKERARGVGAGNGR
ncbi:MAG: hypothetical protein IPI84_12505 [Holophagaceae bacterium]|nr:hypothetical protein [Holophagaceae bacterium]